MPRRAATPDLDVVAVEGDVDRAEIGRRAGALLDQPAQTVRERDAARLDPDERDAGEVRIRLDDLVRDPRQRPPERVGIEEDGSRREPPPRSRRRQGRRFAGRQIHTTPSRPHWTGLKGFGSGGTLNALPDGAPEPRPLRGVEVTRPRLPGEAELGFTAFESVRSHDRAQAAAIAAREEHAHRRHDPLPGRAARLAE